MGGHVRVGEDERVLRSLDMYRQDIWWLIVYLEGGELKYDYVRSSSLEQLTRLEELLERLRERGLKHLVFAIWHGRWRTDVFLMDSSKVLRHVGER